MIKEKKFYQRGTFDLLTLLGLAVLLLALPAGVKLVKERKEIRERATGCPPASCTGNGYLCANGCDCNWDQKKGVRWHYKCINGNVESYNVFDSSCDSSCGGGGEEQTCPPGNQGQPGEKCSNLAKCDIAGGCNPACCQGNSDCPSGQSCDIPNGYCRSGKSCNPSGSGYHKACVDQKCVNVPGAGTDQCNSDSQCQPQVTPSPSPTPPTSCAGKQVDDCCGTSGHCVNYYGTLVCYACPGDSTCIQGRGCVAPTPSPSPSPTPSPSPSNECAGKQVDDCCGSNGHCVNYYGTVVCYGCPSGSTCIQGQGCVAPSPTPSSPPTDCSNPKGNQGNTRCASENTLATCVFREGSYFWYGITCNFGCQNGRCIQPTPTPTPSPSPTPTSVPSTSPTGCLSPSGEKGDTRCTSEKTLATCGFRDGNYFWYGITCSFGCRDGVCVQPTPPLTTTPSPALPPIPGLNTQVAEACLDSYLEDANFNDLDCIKENLYEPFANYLLKREKEKGLSLTQRLWLDSYTRTLVDLRVRAQRREFLEKFGLLGRFIDSVIDTLPVTSRPDILPPIVPAVRGPGRNDPTGKYAIEATRELIDVLEGKDQEAYIKMWGFTGGEAVNTILWAIPSSVVGGVISKVTPGPIKTVVSMVAGGVKNAAGSLASRAVAPITNFLERRALDNIAKKVAQEAIEATIGQGRELSEEAVETVVRRNLSQRGVTLTSEALQDLVTTARSYAQRTVRQAEERATKEVARQAERETEAVRAQMEALRRVQERSRQLAERKFNFLERLLDKPKQIERKVVERIIRNDPQLAKPDSFSDDVIGKNLELDGYAQGEIEDGIRVVREELRKHQAQINLQPRAGQLLRIEPQMGRGAVQTRPVPKYHGGVVQDVPVVKGRAAGVGDGVSTWTGKEAGVRSRNAASIATENSVSGLNELAESGRPAREIADEAFALVESLEGQVSRTGGGTTLVASGVTNEGKLVTVRVGDTEATILRDGISYHIDDLLRPDGFHLFRGPFLPPEYARGSAVQAAKRVSREGVVTVNPNSLGDLLYDPRVTVHSLKKGDLVLLTSDGIRKVLSEAEIIQILTAARTPVEAEVALVKAALNRGLVDDYGVAVIFYK